MGVIHRGEKNAGQEKVLLEDDFEYYWGNSSTFKIYKPTRNLSGHFVYAHEYLRV